MSVAAVRVDCRLVHGQVVETWLPALKVARVLVIDADAASSQLAQSAMRLALPQGIALRVIAPGEDVLPELDEDGERTLILVSDVETAARLATALDLAERGVLFNVGVVQHDAGRRPITPGIHLSEREIDLLADLDRRGVRVEVRGLPSHNPLAVEDVRARYLKAG
jgi:mannose/fructose/N-acetylgalactosamine-specific phosphotransferase system component IIB